MRTQIEVEFVQSGAREWLGAEHWAVPSAPYNDLDEGQAGITTADIKVEDIRPLVDFDDGADVFLFSAESLDDTDDQTEHDTRIWWRADIVRRNPYVQRREKTGSEP